MLRHVSEPVTTETAANGKHRKTPGARPGLWAAALAVAIAALVFLVWATITISGSPASPLVAERVLSVPVREAQAASSYDVNREFVGKVEADRQSALGFELNGKLVSIAVDEGHQVLKGDVIAQLDTAKLVRQREVVEARLASATALLDELVEGPRREVIEAARAEVARLQAQSALAQRNATRAKRLIARNAISQEELDAEVLNEAAARAALRAQQARLDELEAGTRVEQIAAQRAIVRQTEAELRSIDVDLERSRLDAPFDGTIGRRHVDEGVVIAAGAPVVELVETGRLRVRMGLTSRAAEALQENHSASVTIDGVAHQARVVAKRPDRDGTTRTVTVLLELPPDAKDVRVGDLATLRVERTVDTAGFWLPTSALTEGARGLWACYVAVPLGQGDTTSATHELDRRPLEMLHSDTERVFVQGALDPEALVVTHGLQRLVPKQRVQIAREAR